MLELERRVEPWCPGDCAVGVPFVASYRKGTEHLVFVGAHHAFQSNSPTMRAVEAGFDHLQPEVVILEGFPTAMGENPPPLVGRPIGTERQMQTSLYEEKACTLHQLPWCGRFRSSVASRLGKSRVKFRRPRALLTPIWHLAVCLVHVHGTQIRRYTRYLADLAKFYLRLAQIGRRRFATDESWTRPPFKEFREVYKTLIRPRRRWGIDQVSVSHDFVNDSTRERQQDMALEIVICSTFEYHLVE